MYITMKYGTPFLSMNIRVFALLLLFVFSVNMQVMAQETAAEQTQETAAEEVWYLNKEISGFEYVGLRVIGRVDMNNVLSNYRGQEFTSELLQEIQETLYELEFFQELIPEAKQGPNGELILSFTFIENPSISRIRFIGNERIGSSTLLGAVSVRRNEIVNDLKLKRDIQELTKTYYNQGYPNVQIDYQTIPDEVLKNKVEVLFTIVENSRITISEIAFVGNNFYSDEKLTSIISSKVRSIFQKGTFSDIQIANDKRLIEEEYSRQGFIDAKVVDVITEKIQDPEDNVSSNVKVRFVISENSQYILGDISFGGNLVFSTEELRRLFVIQENDILDFTKIQVGYDALRLKYADEGFIFNRFVIDEDKDENIKKISYSIEIEEYGQSHIENIIFRGNITTKDFVVERELVFEEGDLFSSRALKQSRLNLLGTRYFKNVIPETKPGSVPGLVDLVLNLEEDSSRDIRVGLTFGGSIEFPVSLYLTWNQSNLFGRGLTWNNSVVASYGEQTFESTFIEPYFLGSAFLLSASLFFTHEIITNASQDIRSPFLNGEGGSVNYDPYTGKYVFTSPTTHNGVSYAAGDPFPGTPSSSQISDLGLEVDRDFFGSFLNSIYNNSLMDYDSYRIGGSLGTGYTYRTPFGNFGTRVSLGSTFSYVYYDKLSFRSANLQTRKNLETWRVFNSLSLTLFYDSRDLYFAPSSGFYVKQNFTFVGGLLFGDSHFIRTNTLAEAHVTLFDWQLLSNWSWKMVLAGQTSFSSIIPQFFYPQGSSFATDGPTFSQKLRLNGITDARGWYRIYNGEATWNSWVELRMPLFEDIIWWDQFFEVAALWTSYKDLNIYDTNVYFTFGSGFRFVLRQFPLRVYFAKRFLLQDGVIDWQRGNLTASSNVNDDSGIDLIFSISIFE